MDYLEQFRQVLLETPRIALFTQNCENCDFNVFLYASKNCYMCRGSSYLEDSMYDNISLKLKNCTDCAYCKECELCYQCLDSERLYNCDYCQDCRDCHDCMLCYDCVGCSDCFACVGLRNAKYHILNKPYSPEEFRKKKAQLLQDPDRAFKAFTELQYSVPRLHLQGMKNENSTGDHISECKDCHYAFNASESQDCVYICDEVFQCKDSCDISHAHRTELTYDSLSVDNVYNSNGLFWAVNTRDCEYGFCLQACSNCFMCSYLQRKEYYILNKPYSKEEYFKRTAEIKSWLKEKGLYGQNLVYLVLKDTPEVAHQLD